ncbi:MAG: DUF1330 domain-containing protein [Myxococcota bacterium]
MPTIEPTQDQIAALMSASLEGPVQMVNLLKFKGEEGRIAYSAYAAGVVPHLARVGASLLFRGQTRLTFIGDDAWDEVLIVQYPSRQAFIDMIMHPDYIKLAIRRSESLEDSRLYCTQA